MTFCIGWKKKNPPDICYQMITIHWNNGWPSTLTSLSKKKNVSYRKYSVNVTSNLEPAVASHDCGIMVMWLPSQSFKNLQFFFASISTSRHQGWSVACHQSRPLFTLAVSVPLRSAFSANYVNCRYCFVLCGMPECDGWALWVPGCSWPGMVLSCEAANIKGRRCKS